MLNKPKRHGEGRDADLNLIVFVTQYFVYIFVLRVIVRKYDSYIDGNICTSSIALIKLNQIAMRFLCLRFLHISTRSEINYVQQLIKSEESPLKEEKAHLAKPCCWERQVPMIPSFISVTGKKKKNRVSPTKLRYRFNITRPFM